ncbi:hypothetical protein GRI89_01725 [Altererythrobacter salegens]|uniref:Uncharacterized protein n=1 Tax=Croceibacterium salegens TaxID=1737568 RepID=A0A6I4SQY7_9SPHN|nr:hypothetical protein [Croceibacterium salegens]MXO58263.1 hypothetical protein [Croceibacterium salegens]
MICELTPAVIARKRRLARICVLMSAMLSSTVVISMTILMVTGPAGLA